MKKVLKFLFALLCITVGLYPVTYFLIDRQFGLLASKSAALLSDLIWNISFYSHIIPGGLALLIGWMQFSSKLRTKRKSLHRLVGKTYVLAVLISATSGLYIALFATGGIVSMLGFFTLGVVWLGTTINGFLTVRKGKIAAHEKYMTYSYAACFAAVSLRIWLPVLIGLTGSFINAYQLVAWLCWVPNLVIAYFLSARKDKKPGMAL